MRNMSTNKHGPSVEHNGGAFGNEHPIVDIVLHYTVRDFRTKQLKFRVTREHVKGVTHFLRVRQDATYQI